jgi:hypothetical protein
MSVMGMFQQLGATFPFVLGSSKDWKPKRQVFRCLDQLSSLGDQSLFSSSIPNDGSSDNDPSSKSAISEREQF